MNQSDERTFAERVEEALTIEAFRAWLESKRSGEVVGRACNSYSCPIREFLEPHFRKQIAERRSSLQVISEEVVFRPYLGRPEGANLPGWASEFVTRTDSAFSSVESDDDSFCPPVTAEQALAILAKVEKELANTNEK